ncbi:pyrimidine-specific ribonucleoside hydrolase [Hydrogenispora ethanolica]|uniref:Pyrimidine-specific ribonucleoside hydrolase n=1 Tax=Hydrogenispora ethanolica TaxID=1082276 RepID=A0A4R1RIH3_HYDET|nr:pyrimidine-specific ribonucleoside hydrolase RihA [Hydrogenispora ethanolica]TCL65894.1 pyrimidine-specific ribonucleoside hydrolase [Hydrogenispora ethanolica]
MRKPVILDCDPGHDDAIALLLAFASDKLDVKAVTVLAGNQTVEKTLHNALKVLSFAGITVEVAKGAAKPLMRQLQIAPEVHGDSGLDGPVFPPPTLHPSPDSAVDLIARVLRNSDQKVTLIPTGALTNIALTLLAHPELKEKIERISLMGGACFTGNWTPAAEFNILVDPEAARLVFDSGIPITMCGLDVTHRALIYRDEIERIRRIGKKVPTMVAELLDYFFIFHRKMGFSGCPLHDPCAVGYVIDPSLITTKACHVDIETKGEHTLGTTVVDYYDVWKKPKNAEVALGIDRERFIELLIQSVQYYD